MKQKDSDVQTVEKHWIMTSVVAVVTDWTVIRQSNAHAVILLPRFQVINPALTAVNSGQPFGLGTNIQN